MKLIFIQHNNNYTITSYYLFRHLYASFITSVTYDPPNFQIDPYMVHPECPNDSQSKNARENPG